MRAKTLGEVASMHLEHVRQDIVESLVHEVNATLGDAAAAYVPRANIPAGRCARLRLVGLSDDLEAPATWLYRSWLPGSGETLRDFPLFCERSNFGPGMPEGEMVTDLYLPLA